MLCSPPASFLSISTVQVPSAPMVTSRAAHRQRRKRRAHSASPTPEREILPLSLPVSWYSSVLIFTGGAGFSRGGAFSSGRSAEAPSRYRGHLSLLLELRLRGSRLLLARRGRTCLFLGRLLRRGGLLLRNRLAFRLGDGYGHGLLRDEPRVPSGEIAFSVRAVVASWRVACRERWSTRPPHLPSSRRRSRPRSRSGLSNPARHDRRSRLRRSARCEPRRNSALR